jgi:heme-degrading monooxygenase HmoA
MDVSRTGSLRCYHEPDLIETTWEDATFAVIFEVQPRKERFDEYLDLAKRLKPELEKIEGFIDVERYGSKRTQGRVLSLSVFRDEKALVRWRTLGAHHAVQGRARAEIFEDYRLRVGEITADSQAQGSLPMQRLDETEVGDAKAVTISELLAAPSDLAAHLGAPAVGGDGLLDYEVFESIYNAGKLLLLASWREAAAADRWRPDISDGLRHRQVRVIRDYGMFDRREAPQFYPPARRGASEEAA